MENVIELVTLKDIGPVSTAVTQPQFHTDQCLLGHLY